VTRLEERIRTGLQETAERIPDTVPTRAAEQSRSTRPSGVWVAIAAVVGVLVLFTPILLLRGSDPDTTPADDLSPFLGTWEDGWTQALTIENLGGGDVDIVVLNDHASVCSGTPSTMIGIGHLQDDTELVIAEPVLTCDDGTEPQAVSGPPLEEQLRNLTFTYHPESDTLIDNFGSEWLRPGAEVVAHPLIRWPQSSLEEVEEAQELADAGDPNYTWQLEPDMESMDPGQVPELLARVVRKGFGWEEFAQVGISGEAESEGIRAIGFQVIRCEPGKSNPLWPNDPVFGDCAPTIDDSQYESVEIFVAQPGKQGPEGIWVASAWSETDPLTQITPITDDEIAAIVEAFLQARIDGEGAEQYLGSPDELQHFEIPFLYATSTGAPYERAEFEIEDGEIGDQGPQAGGIGLKVRLFAEEGQTVVEQTFELEERMGDWVIYQHEGDETTENGVPLPRP
jgi:hypothetical protein